MIAAPGRIFFTLLCLSGILRLQGQLGPQIISSDQHSFSHQYTLLGDHQYYFIDTSFNSLHWYHQFNQANRDLFGYARLGNMGAPLNALTTEPLTPLWTNITAGGMNPYLKRREDIPLYYVRSPLTEATYWMGYERGQSFNFYHTQNINENWNFLVNYKNLNATGDYLRNYNKHFTFLANTHYRNKDWGYEAYAHFLSEKMTNQENGGIANDSVFEENSATAQPRTLLAVNLPLDRRTVLNREVFLHQDLNIARLWQKPDSLGVLNQNNYFKVGHQFRYSRLAMNYRGNANSAFYDNYFFSKGEYDDSISYRSYENTAFIKTQVGHKTRFALKAGLRSMVTSYGNSYFRLTTSNLGIVSDISARFSDRLNFGASLDYIFVGELDQSLEARANVDLRIIKQIFLFGAAQFQVRNPLFYQVNYVSNNYIWLNEFDKEVNTAFSAGLRWNEANYLRISNTTFDNRVYYGSEVTPVQNAELVNVLKLELKQGFRLWRFLHQDNQLIYQRSDNQTVMPLPEYVGRHSLYFVYELFGGALKCQTGAELNYFSSYFSPSYDPATGMFYNAGEKEIGNYPLVDVFANFKLRKTIFFIKFEHANEGLSSYSYYAAPSYPFPDRNFRIGISWRFFN